MIIKIVPAQYILILCSVWIKRTYKNWKEINIIKVKRGLIHTKFETHKQSGKLSSIAREEVKKWTKYSPLPLNSNKENTRKKKKENLQCSLKFVTLYFFFLLLNFLYFLVGDIKGGGGGFGSGGDDENEVGEGGAVRTGGFCL